MPHRDHQNTETEMSISLDGAEKLFYATRNFLVRAKFSRDIVGLGHFRDASTEDKGRNQE